MKAESAILVAISVCVFLAFYFSLLSFQAVNDTLKRQLVILAAISLLTGIIVFSCLIIYLGIRKVFVEAKLSNIQESSRTEQSQHSTID